MPIVDNELWQSWVDANQDPYGKYCVNVARQVMVILDEEPDEFDCHTIICRADEEIETDGLTGFMAGCVAQMVSETHSRGEEFRRKWNCHCQISDEGEKANESGGVLNPAVLSLNSAVD